MNSHLLPSLGFSPTPLVSEQMVNMLDNTVDTPGSETPVSESGDDRDRQITTLARSISQISRTSSVRTGVPPQGINTFLDTISDPELNPNSDQFNSRKWVKNIIQMTSSNPDRYPARTAGVSFRNLKVFGYGTGSDYQTNFATFWLKGAGWVRNTLGLQKKVRIDILQNFEGILHSGEMLVVLGRPGSGCSTFLKTIAGETHGLYLDKEKGSDVQYDGISWDDMHSCYRGEVIYQAETETHFPQLTVGDTLLFAAHARAPSNRLPSVTRDQYATHMRDVVMATLGLTHTMNTKVGNELIRGVSGGERKRVSIAETTLCRCPLQCWDNSTRGLDSATALEFVKNIRLSTNYSGSTALVAVYQASQSIYDLFDKVIVLYEGRQIYFGSVANARRFFVNMGFYCPDRQTTADFLTSLTSPSERLFRLGFEDSAPRTPDEFAARWKESPERKQLLVEIETNAAGKSDKIEQFRRSRAADKARFTRESSPYTLSYPMQIRLCLWRGFLRLKADIAMTLATLLGNVGMSLIISSLFYDTPDNTDSFYHRGSLLFFAIMISAFSSSLEIMIMWQQRPIVEKHRKYALYHASAEAFSAYIVELPSKLLLAVTFNLIIYFLPHLRRTAGHFFIFFLISVTTTLVMSNIFRFIGAISRSVAQAMPPASVFMLVLVIYTGITIPVRDMHPWFRWLNYVNPIAALMINEFGGRSFPCANFVPGILDIYKDAPLSSKICSQKGAVAGQNFIDGEAYINTTYEYYSPHLWRNFGILCAFFAVFFGLYLYSSELIRAKPSKGEILVYPRGKVPSFAKNLRKEDPEEVIASEKGAVVSESQDTTAAIVRQTSIFHWEHVCFDIKINGVPRRILDSVDGWVKPGTLTALMGVTGAGKTSLLDLLADRVTIGVVSGDMLIDGRLRDDSFQRKTGYVQQQDLHMETSTVREALVFSALLRQPASSPRREKIAYVEEVIHMLGMEEYADAVVGIAGEGLNVEQRKRLTIGVELAAKPDLLLFFDEPTSGLDSQTAWSICTLMRNLANHGQAVLCTIHQPSAMLMQQFDRLLFLAKGGRTVYFGDLGPNMETLIKYFEHKGSIKCPKNANPAEWMLEVIGAAPGSHADIDWAEQWTNSAECAEVHKQLAQMKEELSKKPVPVQAAGFGEFAMPIWYQILICTQRTFEQYWRSPSYLYAKTLTCTVPPLFLGFTFYHMPTSLQGLQNQMFAIFMILVIFPGLVQQMMPAFDTYRALYEARERPAKTYSWIAFMIANILVELAWNIVMSIPVFFSWYYPIGFYRNAEPTNSVIERSAIMYVLILLFMIFTSTFSSMMIAGIEHPDTASNIAQFMFSMCLVFNGVLTNSSSMPRFWIFMNRVSPFTYFVSAVLSTGLTGTTVQCSSIEVLTVSPPGGQTCGGYLHPYIEAIHGTLLNPQASADCKVCTMSRTDQFLANLNMHYSDVPRNIGFLFVYIGFNIVAALFLYWLCRVPRRRSRNATKI
ncbi:CDR ABC transporter [Penicillium fimorum]|uniref:CDR ABC transporter n=1 Tax=Penicillium fimorum TaxID=1882269 RepID=A0A9W9Y6L5_9EURO|nr:CDR ABC transporter [Penicillium fimorum]